ncbi:MAG TPA: hypothetical protein ENI34_10330 [candidate division WOR-3 bacterium]|uniref:Uncharacterized protein n=1 Tax=candidate division WOR-3 bacterium TaxID=2052148 RepID=A0A9C9EP23_UNCW3|nr:hypothetical protein [candidate division WOR-3 bacterium]
MAWPSQNHLENLEAILVRLHWLLQPDTVLTELPYDLEFVSQTDLERFTDWCRSAVSKSELEKGTHTINRALIDFFVKKNHPQVGLEQRKKRVESLFRQLHNILDFPDYMPIPLNKENIGKIFVKINETPGESHFEKTAKKIKIGVALKWLQDSELNEKLSENTVRFISRLGDYYGKVKRGERVYVRDIGTYRTPEDDTKVIVEDYGRKVELALIEASSEIKNVKLKYHKDEEFGQFGKIINMVRRIEKYINGGESEEYDYIEQFRDIIFVVIILNYIQDPYIKRTKEAVNLLKLTLPLYQKYLEFEGRELKPERKPYV